MGIVKSYKQTDKMTDVQAWKIPLAAAAEWSLDEVDAICGIREDNDYVKKPDLSYRDLSCESQDLLIVPGICRFVPTQVQCTDWEEDACFCLQQPAPEPEPESEEEVPDNTTDTTIPDETNKAEEGDDKEGDDKDMDKDDYDMDMHKDMEWIMYADPHMGMITYTSVAVMSAVGTALDIFRYNPAATKYAGWANLGASATTNYWQYGSEMARYTGLAFWSVASVTQMLSMFQVAPEVNMMVWMYGGMAALCSVWSPTASSCTPTIRPTLSPPPHRTLARLLPPARSWRLLSWSSSAWLPTRLSSALSSTSRA